MQRIDVDLIMSEIRKEIKEKGYKEEDLKFQDIPIPTIQGMDNGKYNAAELLNQVNLCNKDWNNPMFFPFPGSNPVKKLFQKIIRKVSKCVFWPIVNYQNKFNSDVVRTLNQLKYYVDDENTIFEEIRKQIQTLEQEQKATRKFYEELTNEKLEAVTRQLILTDEKLRVVTRQLMGVKWKQNDELAKKEEHATDIIRCNICGYHAQRGSFETKEAECIFRGGRLVRYVCPECGVIFGPTKFMNLSQNDIDEDYKIHYYGFDEGCSFDKEIEAFYMLNPNKDGVYLNYGCGCWSKSIQQLRADGYNVYGYEPYASEADNPYMITNEAELVKMKFDGIYSNDLLEHLLDPIEGLRFMKTLLMHPESKMAHSTACYMYKYEYTRFHTHFFTGNSVEIMSKQAGLKILDHRNAMEERDFICYVFAGENDRVDYKSCLYVSEYGERKDGNIILHKKGLMCGPYMILGKGRYRMNFAVKLSDREVIMLKITADKGRKVLLTAGLKDGDNAISFFLEELQQNVEFTISNDGSEDIIIKEVSMF